LLIDENLLQDESEAQDSEEDDDDSDHASISKQDDDSDYVPRFVIILFIEISLIVFFDSQLTSIHITSDV
jgi:hypothetical protein